MFGGNPSKNPFGAPPSKASNIFGSPQDATSRKRGNDSSSRLYGMPPLPEIGKPATTGMVDSSAIFVPKKPLQTSDPNPSSNIFANAMKESNVENNANVFSKPPSGTYKPDLFQSIEPAAKGLFQGGPTTGVKSTFGAFKPQETSNIFKTPAVSESTNLFPKPPEKKSPFTIPDAFSGPPNFFNPPKSKGSIKITDSKPDEDSSEAALKGKTQTSIVQKTEESENLFKSRVTNTFQKSGPTQGIFKLQSGGVFKTIEGAKSVFKAPPLTTSSVENLPISTKMKGRLGTRKPTVEDDPESEEGSVIADEEKQTSPKFQRLTSVEELKAIKSIVCEQVPPQALNKKVLEKHFAKFGKLTKVTVNLKKALATIHFEDHKSANKAKNKGHSINAMIPPIGKIFYRRDRKAPSISTEADIELPEKPKLSMEQPENRSLMQIVRSQAQNDNDKHDILAARDKLMREKAPPKDGTTILKGCCPDICPEKERYSRASKNQLRPYEKCATGEIDHKATIKEYSRSSADQQIAHLHELRPSNVLQTAMNHLLCNAIDRIEMNLGGVQEWYANVMAGCDYPHPPNQSDNGLQYLKFENVGEWFEYLWSTTRAIRKDITQQDLKTDPLAVDLIEKIARFHIMCGERLVEEDSSNYEPKLNDENLTKCIQTLKHMYYDMGIEGHKCPNESEFRGYDVLLKLNDGDTLRIIQTLDTEVRTSAEIKFALEALTAINTNNYVRFFKVVGRASLLQACILFRYFGQVRQRALETMVKAYCSGKVVVQYSLSKLTSLLAFEDEEQCAQFCQSCGISAELDSDLVYMERSSFYYPDSSSTTVRARQLVESKRHLAWSAIINGGHALPPNPYLTYSPHDSFDVRGFLKPEAYDASDQCQDPTEAREEQELLFAENAQRAREQALKQAIDQVADSLIDELVNEKVATIGRDHTAADKVIQDTCLTIESEVLTDLVREVSKNILKEARNEEIQRRLDNEAKDSAVDQIHDDLVMEVVSDYAKEIASQEMLHVHQLNKYISTCPQIADELISEVLNELVEPQLAQVLEDLTREREQKIESLRQKQILVRKQKVFKSWSRYVRKRKSQRSILEKFPCMPSSLKCQDQLKSVGVLRTCNLKDTLQIRRQVDKLHDIINLEDKIVEESILEPILDLPEMLHANGIRQWKLIVCGPSLDSDNVGKGLVEMTKKKLSIAVTDQDQVEPNVLSCFASPRASIVVRWIDGDMMDQEIAYSEKKRRDYLTGTSAILFFHINEDESVEVAKSRLFQLLALIPKVPGVALMILTTSSDFMLEQAPEGVHSYDIFQTNVDIFRVSTLTSVVKSVEALTRLTRHFDMDSVHGLNVKLLRDFVEDFLVENFFVEIYVDLKERLQTKREHCHPNDLIGLYNDVIDHLVEVVTTDTDLENISWPIPELKKLVLDEDIPSYWNDFPYLEHLRTWITNLKLPLMNHRMNCIDDLEQYMSSISKSYATFSLAHTRIKAALDKVQRKKLSLDQAPWTDIVHALIDYKLGQRSTLDPFSSHGSDMVVLFFEQKLKSFHPSKSWQRSRVAMKNLPQEETGKSTGHSKSQLQEGIEAELNASIKFEQNLEAMIMNEGYKLHEQNDSMLDETLMTQDTDEEEELIELATNFHYPVVSMVSPNLGLIAGSRALQQRVDHVITKKRPKQSEPMMESTTDSDGELQVKKKPKKTIIKSHLVQSLNDKAEAELNLSNNFEQKLLATLHNF